MKRLAIYTALIISFSLILVCCDASTPPSSPLPSSPAPDTEEKQPIESKTTGWTMTALLKDWLITPADLAIKGQEIYVSGKLDKRIAVLNLDGQILRYYIVDKNLQYDNVCVGVTSQGQVLAISSLGLWELKPDGQAKELLSFRNRGFYIHHMAVGPDDDIYISRGVHGKSTISKVGLDGTMTDILKVDSNRVSDLDFDSNGNLFMFDGEHGQILKYSQDQGAEVFATGFSEYPFGSGPMYLTFDEKDRLYVSLASNQYRLAIISKDGEAIPLGFYGDGDMVFHDGFLYTVNVHDTLALHQLEIDRATIHSKRLLIEGAVPWNIEQQDDFIVGRRPDPYGAKFYNYHLHNPVQIEPNHMLNRLQPNQYTFDDGGNAYLLFRDVLKKVTSTGEEVFSVVLPHEIWGDLRLCHNPLDDKIYYFDEILNSVIRADMKGWEVYHEFSSPAKKVFLTTTPQGKIYAGVVSPNKDARLIDISNPSQEIIVWKPSGQYGRLHVDSDAEGNLYTVLGPAFQQVFFIDPSDGKAVSIVPQSPYRYDMGFVDPNGFIVTKSGTIIISAPGVLIEFSQK